MITLSYVVDTKVIDGRPVNINRKFFFYDDIKDWVERSHKHYTYEQKKIAKQLYKLNKK